MNDILRLLNIFFFVTLPVATVPITIYYTHALPSTIILVAITVTLLLYPVSFQYAAPTNRLIFPTTIISHLSFQVCLYHLGIIFVVSVLCLTWIRLSASGQLRANSILRHYS